MNTFLIALADNAGEPTHMLELQKALEPAEDDPDSDTSCLVLDGEATHYGGVTACELSKRTLVLRLDDEAAGVLERDSFEIDLDLDGEERGVLRVGLVRLFQGDRLAPPEMVLE